MHYQRDRWPKYILSPTTPSVMTLVTFLISCFHNVGALWKNTSPCFPCVIIIQSLQKKSRCNFIRNSVLTAGFQPQYTSTRARCRREISESATQRAFRLKPSHISSFRMCCSVWNTFTQVALCLPPRSPMHGNWQEHVNMGSSVTCQWDCAG